MSERPSNQQLHYFASLVTGKVSDALDPQNISTAEFIDTLDYHGITLLALQNGTLPTDVIEKLGSRKAMMVANDVLKQTALTELFEAFEQAGLSNSILFKGSALAYTVYPQPWLRPRSDSDCLIDQSDYVKFASIFSQLGYQKLFAIEGQYLSYQSTFSKILVGQAAINIDLHWRINNRQTLACAFNVHELIEHSQCLSMLSNSIKIPCPVDSVLIASLHRLGHHQNEERLTWLYDIHLLVGALNQNNWQQLCDKASDKKLAAITLDALRYCQHLFDTNIPSFAESALTKSASQPEPSQLFLKRELSEWQIFAQDLKSLAGWQKKFYLVFESVFPNSDYVRQQMETDNIVLAHYRRILRGLRRITR